MTIVDKLHSSIGEGGAFLHDSHGKGSLSKVLRSLAEIGVSVQAYDDGAIATGVKGTYIAPAKMVLIGARAHVGTTGSSGTTTIQVRVNGVAQATYTLSAPNTDADGTDYSVEPATPVEINAGDRVDVNVSAAATGGATLYAAAYLRTIKEIQT